MTYDVCESIVKHLSKRICKHLTRPTRTSHVPHAQVLLRDWSAFVPKPPPDGQVITVPWPQAFHSGISSIDDERPGKSFGMDHQPEIPVRCLKTLPLTYIIISYYISCAVFSFFFYSIMCFARMFGVRYLLSLITAVRELERFAVGRARVLDLTSIRTAWTVACPRHV